MLAYGTNAVILGMFLSLFLFVVVNYVCLVDIDMLREKL